MDNTHTHTNSHTHGYYTLCVVHRAIIGPVARIVISAREQVYNRKRTCEDWLKCIANKKIKKHKDMTIEEIILR